MKYTYHRLLLLLVALLTAQLGWSQGATTAAMSGTIADNKGQVLPGATVIAVHTPTNTQYVAPTNAEGRFNIQNMRVGGPYTVKVTFVGYQDYTRTGINLTLAENYRLDAKLGEATTSLAEVTVTGGRQNPVINADRTGAATTVQREAIERLPTLNRSFNDFTRLTPQASGQSFGGRNTGFNNITIDGAIFNNSFGLASTVGGQAGAQPISIDAIDQIQVSIAPYDVRQGSFTGAGINAVTRSGSNRVSASVYGFYRNQDLVGSKVGDVNSAYPPFNLKNFGFRVGGPIVKDKLFFFVNAERELRNAPPTGNYQASVAGQAATATTSAATSQDLTALSNFLRERYGYETGAYQNYQLRQNSDKITARLDWNISPNNRFNIKYNYLKSYADIAPSASGAVGTRSQSQFGLPYQSAYYTINNNLNSFIAELNSTLGAGKFSNNLTAGYSAFRDFRSTLSSVFPLVDIGTNVGLTAFPTATNNNPAYSAPTATLTSFGYEPFTAGNVLNTDVYQVGDNFTAYLGKHNVTVGTYNEFYKFTNGFAPNYNGLYRYNSLEDFYNANGYSYDRTNGQYTAYNTTTNPSPGRENASVYRLQYNANGSDQIPFAYVNAQQYGLYLQDEYSPRQNLKFTVGIRGDLPVISNNLVQNVYVGGGADASGSTGGALTFRNGVQLNTGQIPVRKVLYSPRIGFNWDVNDDRKTQVRGGTGIFTGRVPYVLISNQASNNGILFGALDATASGNPNILTGPAASPTQAYPFNPNVNAYRPTTAAAAPTGYNLAVTDQNFKFPQVWRSNLAIDKELFGGIVATIEGLYTKDMNALAFENVNLPNPVRNANAAQGQQGGDARPIFYNFSGTPNANGLVTATPYNRIYGLLGTSSAPTNTARTPNITDAILMKNTNKGYSYSLTAQLQKSFSNGLFASAAYTYTDSRSVNDGGSTPTNIWRDRYVSGDPNADALSYSSYLQQHRIVAALSYRREYLGHLGTTLSAFYVGAPAFNGLSTRFSYTYAGDMNGDGQTVNDLVYIPRSATDINLIDIAITDTRATGGGTPARIGTYTAAQQYADLDAYISQDPYLSKHRGEYMERNGAQNPWQHQIDVKLLQDIFTNIGKDRNTLQLTVDIFNVGNLLNSNWGKAQFANRTALLSYQGYNAAGQPVFTFPYLTAPVVTRGSGTTPGIIATPGTALSTTYRDDVTSLASRWQMQLGVRYIFN
ncbi:TonB-dependent receptor [Hymenobacter sp. HMF4947]|uniref:TonB-dependent receptor n=1 Tax=Hymenobacter ginkgonis TaxID=2682976 RepID=A0A7K1TJ46_9BACT|nr:carboxypeptidase regulatory-like domain-containing protein [Hymenobacter ginkgonis]MVN78392.1 TonB-dependent receptor [Hymenobacter ginkgonis]